MQNKQKKEKMTWKEIKNLLGYGIGAICGLLLKDSVWLDTLSAKLGEGVVWGIYIVVMAIVGVVLYVILELIEKIIEKKRRKAQKPSPQGEA